jgi:hypothetical protein
MKISESPTDREVSTFDRVVKTEASLTCSVARKINTGDYENIDVMCSVTLPIDIQDVVDMDDLKSVIEDVAEEGFEMTSKETGARYKLIKEKMAGR